MAQQLRALTSFSEDPSWISSVHTVAHNGQYSNFKGIWCPLQASSYTASIWCKDTEAKLIDLKKTQTQSQVKQCQIHVLASGFLARV